MAALPGPVDYLQPEFEGAARGTQTSLPVDFLCYDTQYRVIIEKPAEIFRREVLVIIYRLSNVSEEGIFRRLGGVLPHWALAGLLAAVMTNAMKWHFYA